MALINEKNYTIEDIYALPDGQRAELIDGQLYMMAPPSRIHQEIVHFLDRTIGNYIEKNKGECKIYPAPFAVFLDEENPTYVEPDISVICDKDKLDIKGCHGAPDWIIEIVSPSSKVLDYYKKLTLYKMAGVREYWIVDPLKQVIVVYNLEDEEIPIVYHFSDCVRVNIYENLEIDFNDLDV